MKALVLLCLMMAFSVCKAADLLTEIDARLLKADVTEGRFTQEKTLKILKKPLLSTGAFTYRREQGVIWRTLTPIASTVLIDQARLLTEQGEQALPPAFGRVFGALFSGDLQTLRDGFEVNGNNGQQDWKLDLQPKDPQMRKIIAALHLSGGRELQAVTIEEAGGNATRIVFTGIRHPDTLTPEQAAEFERLSSPR